jgi:hypothetical protein
LIPSRRARRSRECRSVALVALDRSHASNETRALSASCSATAELAMRSRPFQEDPAVVLCDCAPVFRRHSCSNETPIWSRWRHLTSARDKRPHHGRCKGNALERANAPGTRTQAPPSAKFTTSHTTAESAVTIVPSIDVLNRSHERLSSLAQPFTSASHTASLSRRRDRCRQKRAAAAGDPAKCQDLP